MTNDYLLMKGSTSRLDTIHWVAAVVGCLLLTLPGRPAMIGLIVLLACLTRLPTVLRCLAGQMGRPLFILCVSWWLVAFLSAIWSSHPERSLLASPWLVLIIPAAWPVLAKPRPFILAMGVGAVVHTGIQLATWLGVVEGFRQPWTISGGLHWYPPFTALWSTTVLLLLLGLILTAPTWRNRLVPLLLALPLPVSLVLTGTRTVSLVIPIAIIVLGARLWTIASTRRHRIAILATCGAILAVNLSSLVIPGSMPGQRVAMLAQEVSRTVDDDGPRGPGSGVELPESTRRRQVDRYVNSVGLRVLWWRAGFAIWRDAPWIGHGAGSIRDQLAMQEARMPSAYGADVEGFITPEPHAAILATAIEQGLLGIMLMGSLAVVGVVGAWRLATATPALAGLAAAWVTVTIFSLVHTLQFEDYPATLVAVLVAFTLRPPAIPGTDPP